MNARVIFKKETEEAMNKKLSLQEKGVLLWERLKELEATGRLAQATNRVQVARLCGYTNDNNGWAWVSNMIQKGALVETVVKIHANNKRECEYRLGKREPRVKNYAPEKKPVVKQEQIVVEPKSAKIVVRYKDLSVELEQADSEFALKLISELIEKIKNGE